MPHATGFRLFVAWLVGGVYSIKLGGEVHFNKLQGAVAISRSARSVMMRVWHLNLNSTGALQRPLLVPLL